MNIKESLKSLQSLKNIDAKQLFMRMDILITIAIIVFSLIFFRVINQKQTMQMESLKKKIEQAEASVRLVTKIEDANRQMKDYMKELPVGRDFPDIINEITSIARKNDIEIASLTQESKEFSQQYYNLPLNLSVRGMYYNVWNFLRDIDDSKELLAFNYVKLEEPRTSTRYEERMEDDLCSAEIKLSATSTIKGIE